MTENGRSVGTGFTFLKSTQDVGEWSASSQGH